MFRLNKISKDGSSSQRSPRDESESFPPPPDSPPAFTEYAVGPHRYSLRDSHYTPAVAAQLAQEAVQQNDQKNDYDDESYDVQL